MGDRAEKHLSVVILPNPAEFSLNTFVFGKFGFSLSPVAVPILHLSGSQRLYNSSVQWLFHRICKKYHQKS